MKKDIEYQVDFGALTRNKRYRMFKKALLADAKKKASYVALAAAIFCAIGPTISICANAGDELKGANAGGSLSQQQGADLLTLQTFQTSPFVTGGDASGQSGYIEHRQSFEELARDLSIGNNYQLFEQAASAVLSATGLCSGGGIGGAAGAVGGTGGGGGGASSDASDVLKSKNTVLASFAKLFVSEAQANTGLVNNLGGRLTNTGMNYGTGVVNNYTYGTGGSLINGYRNGGTGGLTNTATGIGGNMITGYVNGYANNLTGSITTGVGGYINGYTGSLTNGIGGYTNGFGGLGNMGGMINGYTNGFGGLGNMGSFGNLGGFGNMGGFGNIGSMTNGFGGSITNGIGGYTNGFGGSITNGIGGVTGGLGGMTGGAGGMIGGVGGAIGGLMGGGSVASKLKACANSKPDEFAAVSNMIRTYFEWQNTELRTVMGYYQNKITSPILRDRIEGRLVQECLRVQLATKDTAGALNYCRKAANWDLQKTFYSSCANTAASQVDNSKFDYKDYVQSCVLNNVVKDSLGASLFFDMIPNFSISVDATGVVFQSVPFTETPATIYHLIYDQTYSQITSSWFQNFATQGCIPSVFAPKDFADKVLAKDGSAANYYSICLPQKLMESINSLPKVDQDFFNSIIAKRISTIQVIELLNGSTMIAEETHRNLMAADREIGTLVDSFPRYMSAVEKMYKEQVDMVHGKKLDDILEKIDNLMQKYQDEVGKAEQGQSEVISEIVRLKNHRANGE